MALLIECQDRKRCGMNERGLCLIDLLQRLLGLMPLPTTLLDPPSGVGQCRGRPPDKTALATPADPIAFVPLRADPSLHQRPELLLKLPDLFRRYEELPEPAALDLFKGITAQRLAGAIEADDAPLAIERRYERPACVQHCIEKITVALCIHLRRTALLRLALSP